MADRVYLERLARDLTDKGKLIEAGWISLRIAAVPLDAPPMKKCAMHSSPGLITFSTAS